MAGYNVSEQPPTVTDLLHKAECAHAAPMWNYHRSVCRLHYRRDAAEVSNYAAVGPRSTIVDCRTGIVSLVPFIHLGLRAHVILHRASSSCEI